LLTCVVMLHKVDEFKDKCAFLGKQWYFVDASGAQKGPMLSRCGVYMCMYTCMCVRACVRAFLYVCVCACMCMHVCVCMCVCVWMCGCVCVWMCE
jgi:hypothetical protein